MHFPAKKSSVSILIKKKLPVKSKLYVNRAGWFHSTKIKGKERNGNSFSIISKYINQLIVDYQKNRVVNIHLKLTEFILTSVESMIY